MGVLWSKAPEVDPLDLQPCNDVAFVSAAAARHGGPTWDAECSRREIRVVMLSDTHAFHEDVSVPPGDILLHCGDFSLPSWGVADLRRFNEWLGKQPHTHKVVVAGNHDTCLPGRSKEEIRRILSHCTYLQDDTATIAGLVIYGAPWTRRHRLTCYVKRSRAFTTSDADVWEGVPDNVDILATHSPPFSIHDIGNHGNMGCQYLFHRIAAVQPRMHAFGHCHGCPGASEYTWPQGTRTIFANVSVPMTSTATVARVTVPA